VRTLLFSTCLGCICARGLAAQKAADSVNEIDLGMSTALSGPQGESGEAAKQGVLAALGRFDAPLRLIALDDAGQPARAAANVRQLVQNPRVLAIIGDVGAPAALASAAVCDDRHALLFAPLSGAAALRCSPPDRYVINYRAGYAEEIGAMIDGLTDTTGFQPDEIAFFTSRDADGDAGFEAAVPALLRHGLEDPNRILHVTYEPNTLDVENALATLLYAEHEPRAIVMVGDGSACAKFVKLASSAGLKSIFLGVSLVGNDHFAADLAGASASVIVTRVTPDPLSHEFPIVREFQSDLKSLDPSAKPGFTTFEAYISCRILLEALQKVPGKPTRQSLIDAMDSLAEFDMGLGAKLRLGPGQHQACYGVWPTILRNGEFAAFDWKNLNDLAPKDAPLREAQ